MNNCHRISVFSALSMVCLGGCSSDPGSTRLPPSSPDDGSSSGGRGGGGGTATDAGGEQNAAGGSTAVLPDEAAFELVFRDDFDSFVATRWKAMTHSWNGNLALFSSDAVSVADGELTISLLTAPEGTVDDSGVPKPYLGAEVRSTETITYGRVRVRARLGGGSAVVSSLVTIYTPWPADNWNELDIECLGRDPSNIQYNAMVYTGAPTTPPVTSSVAPTQDPKILPLGFDASTDFHIYEVEWTPDGAYFSVDDVVQHVWTKNIALMTLPQNVLLTIWASDSAAWAGAVDATTAGASATYDWIEVSRYVP